MSDALPDDAWVNYFLSASPRPLLNSLERRLQASTTHINALAELYKQRAAIETTYAESLSKLARTAEQGGLNGKNGTEWDRNGFEAKIWLSTLADLQETSSAHSTFAQLVRTDFEQPLREMPNKIVAWKRIHEQDASLDKTLKDYEKTSTKLDKAKKGKSDQLSSELNQLTQQLSSLSPMVYTTFQKLDEERLKHLKEVSVRWATVRGDQATRDGQRAENAVAEMLGWETADEVLAVGARLGGTGVRSVAPSAQSTRMSPSATPLTSANRRATVDRESDFTPRPTPKQNGSASNTPTVGGLKSLLGRTKTLARPNRARTGSTATSVRSGANFSAIGEDEPPLSTTAVAPPVDDEGFSVAPADRHRSPWDEPEEMLDTPTLAPTSKSGTRAPAPTPAFAQTFDTASIGSSENTDAPRLNLALAPQPIQESEEDRQAALAKMQQTLQMPSMPNRRSTTRGRRDVRNTMFAGPGGVDLGLPPSPLPENGFPTINRQTSMSSVSSPFDSPALGTTKVMPSSAPGLRASVTESINVITRGDAVQRLQVNGEIHLALQSTSSSPSDQVHIRLTQFEQLEKIAPNPTFLSQVPDKPGEYYLSAAALSSNSGSALLFRYQAHVPPGQEKSALPLLLEPAYQCKDGETRMILNYRRNTESPFANATLSNLTLLAAFAPGPSVTNAQAKPPGGIWSPATRRMTWKPEAPEGKIIARFVNEAGTLSPQGVQASWTIDGITGTGIDLEAVGQDWVFEEVKKGLTTGKYLAEAI